MFAGMVCMAVKMPSWVDISLTQCSVIVDYG
jgi:hypothetical protein